MESSSDKGVQIKSSVPQSLPICRPGYGTKGGPIKSQKKKGGPIKLRTNHFKVSTDSRDLTFYHYHVNLKNEDDQPDAQKGVGIPFQKKKKKGVGRKVIDKLQETYASDLENLNFFAYDGDKSLYTVGALQNVKDVFTVVVEDASSAKTPGGDGSPEGSDMKRMKRLMRVKTFKVELSLAGKVPLSAITKVIRGQESDDYQKGLQVLDIILRQHSARQGCLLVRQSFFHSPSKIINLGGGVVPCPGYHSSFRLTQSGLSLNMDVSTTMILEPGPVLNFILSSQYINNKDTRRIDWDKAKRTLKNLRIKTTHTNSEFKIVDFSEKFHLKQRDGSSSDTVEVTVYDYYLKRWGIKLKDSVNFPCLNVGKPERPTYLPIELCDLVSLQRYTKALTVPQRSSLVQNSRRNPSERKLDLSAALRRSNYNSDSILKKCGISIAPDFIQVDGRVLHAPKLKAGNGRDIFVRDGKWNFNNNVSELMFMLIRPTRVNRWVVVDFSSHCNVPDLVRRLIQCGKAKGMHMDREDAVIKENPGMRLEPAPNRVDDMFDQIKRRFPNQRPAFLLCVLPEKKNCYIYGPWKRACLAGIGIVTQCLGPPPKNLNDQYLTNLLLKINAKIGGLNSLLEMEEKRAIPLVSRVETMILGMDVSHGPPKRDLPSVAAVVSSLGWPCISRYRASVCTQSPRLEMIDSLFKQEGDNDRGLIRELIEDFRNSCEKLPQQIIIFRDGVSEGQFTQVLNIELPQIIEACKFLQDNWSPKSMVIVAQKNHHTRFFRDGNDGSNVPAGTVVDKGICHHRDYDFYMCAHAGRIGTTRPTHYHVLCDEIGFTPDDLQDLVHSLSYVYQRSTSAISVVAPVYYAHLAAAQVRQFVRFDDSSETGSSTSGSPAPVPELPRLNERVRSSMFFC